MEEKTVIEWFEQAKAQGFEWADAAIDCTISDGGTSLRSSNMRKALARAFTWRDTPQGANYWIDILISIPE